MSVHQGVKAEIDARDEGFETCCSLGRQLVSDGHYASEEIQEKLNLLTAKRAQIADRWQDKWDYLTLRK